MDLPDEQEGKRLLFLKKKKQKDFRESGTGCRRGLGTNGQKFFASFFQKRRCFLPSARVQAAILGWLTGCPVAPAALVPACAASR